MYHRMNLTLFDGGESVPTGEGASVQPTPTAGEGAQAGHGAGPVSGAPGQLAGDPPGEGGGEVDGLLHLLRHQLGLPDGSPQQLRQALEEAQQRAQVQQQARQRLREEASRGAGEARRRWERWQGELAQARAAYPHLDLTQEGRANPQFLGLLRAGVPVQQAYEVLHMEEIKAQAARDAAQTAQRQVVEGIRARGIRPAENGTAAQSGFVLRDDVSQLTRQQRAEIARRVERGEVLNFQKGGGIF